MIILYCAYCDYTVYTDDDGQEILAVAEMMETKHENKEMKEIRVAGPALPLMIVECGGGGGGSFDCFLVCWHFVLCVQYQCCDMFLREYLKVLQKKTVIIQAWANVNYIVSHVLWGHALVGVAVARTISNMLAGLEAEMRCVQ